MKKVKANRVCEDCGETMFRRGIDTDYGKMLEGWSCPKCHTTKWDDLKNEMERRKNA